MFYFVIQSPILPKPRGKLGRSGNIYHNDKAYTEYKKEIESNIIKAIPKSYQWHYPIGIAIINEFIPKSRGSEADIDNLTGSILDCLVQKSYIPDDSRRYLRSQCTEV